jgi:hypothetical protein
MSGNKNERLSETNLDFLFLMPFLSSLWMFSKQKVDRGRYRDIIGRNGEGFL